MAGEKQLSNNPFLNTLHQRSLSHQKMPALMRVGSSLPLSSTRGAPPENLPTTTGVLQMRREDLPLGWTVPLSHIQAVAVAPTLTSFNKIPQPSQESARVTPAQPSDTPRQQPAQILSSPVQKSSIHPTVKYPSVQPTKEGNLENEWPRLEAIFERHEETRQQSDEIENTIPVEEEETHLEEEVTPPEIASSEKRMIESEMNVLQPDNETEKYIEQVPSAPPQSHLPQAVVQKQPVNNQKPEAPQEVEKIDQPIAVPSSFEKPIPFTQSETVEEVQEQSVPSEVEPANELPLKEDPAQKRSSSEMPAIEEESEVEEVLEQTIPLNAVWPVEQRVINPADYSSSAPTLAIPLQDTPQGTLIQAEKNVHSALEKVPGEHPSRSSIEVITPRHSRPVIQRQSAQIEETPTEEQKLDGETHSDSQNTISKPSSETDVIETDIGPLPADLWTLLGEPLPSETTEPISPPIITKTQSEEKFVQLEKAITAAEKFTPPIDHISTPVSRQPTVIQRSEEHHPQVISPMSQNSVQRTVQPASTDSPDMNERARENEEEKKGFNIESLSRKVYAEIKRRFQCEHERDR